MVQAALNPTSLTPPRVAFLDPQTGAISREWYRFFLSLLTATEDNQNILDLSANETFLLSSFTESFLKFEQAAQSTPPDQTAELAAQTGQVSFAAETKPPTPTLSDVAELRQQIQALALTPPPREFTAPRYGSFYDTTDQTAAAINTAYAMTFNSTDLSFGVTVGTPTSRIYVDRTSLYNIQFSAQLINAAGVAHNTWIWLRKNGTNLANTTTVLHVEGNNTEAVAAWNFLLQMNAGDYFELMWEVSDTSLSLYHDVATAVHPAIPSVILTVTDNISQREV
jgi:hypothetical protein